MNSSNNFDDSEKETFMSTEVFTDDYDIIDASDFEENEFLISTMIPHKTSDKKLLDIFLDITRYVNKTKLILKCEEIFSSNNIENIAQLIVVMFQTRNCRNEGCGKGEKEIFYTMFLSFSRFFPKTCEMFYPLIGEYGYFKDFLFLLPKLSSNLQNSAILYMCNLLSADILILNELDGIDGSLNETSKISLISKWMPREGCSFEKHNTEIFLKIVETYNSIGNKKTLKTSIQKQKYRKDVSKLSKYIDVTEIKMCANKYSEINYKKTPYANISKFRKAHLNEKVNNEKDIFDEKIGNRYTDRQDRIDARQNFLSVETIEGQKVKPHTICDKILSASSSEENILLKQWDDIKMEFLEYNSNCIAIVDNSASMIGLPLSFSISIGILTSELNNGIFGGKVISFSDEPAIINLDKKLTLKEKIKIVKKIKWGSSTNIVKTMDLILDIAVKENLKNNELPTLFILTDMDFNLISYNIDECMEEIDKNFHEKGYTVPKIVFWNLNKNTPSKTINKNITLLSGYSYSFLKYTFSGNTFDNTNKFLEIINDPIYDKVRDILSVSNESILSEYS